MGIALGGALFQVPGPRQFVDMVAGDLAQGRNVMMGVPLGVPQEDVWEVLRGELWNRSLDVEQIAAPLIEPGGTPALMLAEALGVGRSVAKKSEVPEFDLARANLPDVILLTHVDSLPRESASSWVDFIVRWGSMRGVTPNRRTHPTVFCATVPTFDLVGFEQKSDVGLVVRWWWGVVSILELRVLCRLIDDRSEEDPLPLWREHLLPSLSGGDIALASCLWNALRGSEGELLTYLRAHAQERGWTPDVFEPICAHMPLARQAELGTGSSTSPPRRLQKLWSLGAVNQTPEYGVEVSTAALAVLGQAQALRHRLWRGQVGLLLPFLDGIRLTMCAHLTRGYGPDWPLRWRKPETAEEAAALEKDPYSCQFGHLVCLLQDCRPLSAEKHWIPLVALCRWIRNELAHYRPITYEDFQRLWEWAGEILADLGE